MKLKDYIITILLVVCIIVSMVSFYNCKTIIEGKQGEQGIQGESGVDGKDGTNGVDGLAGKDGVSITSANVNSEGYLIVTLSDGTCWNAGLVKGGDGENGKDGINGSNGKNGRGIVSITKTTSSDYVDTYIIKYTDGTTSTFTIP